MSTRRNLGSKQAHPVIHQPVSVVSQCGAGAWPNGLASGDQRRLTEAVAHQIAFATMRCTNLPSHLPEIGAENPYEKTGTINRHENRTCPIRYQKLVPEKFGTKLHNVLVQNCMSDASETGIPVFWYRFWRRFLICVSWALGPV